MTNPIVKKIELSDGRVITLETGKLAKQADGSVTVRMNNTVLWRQCVLPKMLRQESISCPCR